MIQIGIAEQKFFQVSQLEYFFGDSSQPAIAQVKGSELLFFGFFDEL